MGEFPATRWSLIATALADLDGGRALEELCALYLAPIRGIVRGVTRAGREVQDLTQSVFAHLLQRNVLARADPQRGPFRAWLKLVVQTVVSKERRRARARMRGGGVIVLSLDAPVAEGHHTFEPAEPCTPGQDHARHQLAELHQRVMTELEQYYASRGKRELFRRLKPFIDGRAAPYAALAEKFGVAAGTLRKQVRDMKERYARLVRADFRRRGVKPADIDREIRNLLAELS